MNRGDIVTVALPGDYGKPRPALVVQSDYFDQTGSLVVLPLTGTLVDAPLLRPAIAASPASGLVTASQVMVDKVTAVRRDRIGPVIGRAAEAEMLAVTRALALFLGLG